MIKEDTQDPDHVQGEDELHHLLDTGKSVWTDVINSLLTFKCLGYFYHSVKAYENVLLQDLNVILTDVS